MEMEEEEDEREEERKKIFKKESCFINLNEAIFLLLFSFFYFSNF
jgi:hypothetical protein